MELEDLLSSMHVQYTSYNDDYDRKCLLYITCKDTFSALQKLETMFLDYYKHTDHISFLQRAQYELKLCETNPEWKNFSNFMFTVVNNLHNFLASDFHDKALEIIQPLLFLWSLHVIESNKDEREKTAR